MIRALLLMFALIAAPVSARPFTAKDLATMERVGDPQLSPDGRWLAYTLRTVDYDAGAARQAVWALDLTKRDAKAVRVTEPAAGPPRPRWGEGGELYFLRVDGEGVRQLWRTSVGGGTKQLTRAPVDVGAYRVLPGGRTAIAIIRSFTDCETLACTAERLAERKRTRKASQLYDDLSVRFYDSYGDGRRGTLVRLDLDGGAAVPLARGFDVEDDYDFDVTPDGRTIIFSALASGVSPTISAHNHLYRVAVDGSAAPTRLLPEQGGSAFRPAISGGKLAYLHRGGNGSDGERSRLFVAVLDGSGAKELGAALDRWPMEIAWSGDGKRLYGAVDDDGQGRIFAYDLSGKVTPLTGEGVASSIAVGGPALAWLSSRFDSPAQVMVERDRATRQVTQAAAAQLADVSMAKTESVSFPGWNDEPVQAFVTRPPVVPGRKVPVIFLIHGGPHSAYSNEWSYLRNPQIWASRGYATVMVNFHGSVGWGQDFAKSIVRHRGDRPLEDFKRVWPAILARFPDLDGNRACAMGSSFGGYMVKWMAGVWNEPWRCFVAHAGAFDTRGLSYSNDIFYHNDQTISGGQAPWAAVEDVERFNPVAQVDKWSKPILITHGARDYRVPFDQGLSAFAAAQRRGVPSQLLHFPNEHHLILGPQATVEWYAAVNAWLDRWTAP
ncbi:prolyl oligopeptidase family serine peptidase [Sphingoaurantiacus capsulatus]|uniref:Prolyl oligopeptidase family serine peptidase n=1 Tax=Sphingoaurantiacus capsulatus TaxID=1771310 RepID=A0ABV7XBH7_9SPHN